MNQATSNLADRRSVQGKKIFIGRREQKQESWASVKIDWLLKS